MRSAGSSVAVLAQLGDLAVVLGERDHGPGVGQDVGDVLGVGGRVDRGGGRAGAQDREVGEHPVDPGGGDQRDPLLGLDAEVQQPGGEVLHPLAGLAPGDRLPAVADRPAVGLPVGRRGRPGRGTSARPTAGGRRGRRRCSASCPDRYTPRVARSAGIRTGKPSERATRSACPQERRTPTVHSWLPEPATPLTLGRAQPAVMTDATEPDAVPRQGRRPRPAAGPASSRAVASALSRGLYVPRAEHTPAQIAAARRPRPAPRQRLRSPDVGGAARLVAAQPAAARTSVSPPPAAACTSSAPACTYAGPRVAEFEDVGGRAAA